MFWKLALGVCSLLVLVLGVLYVTAPNRIFGLEYVIPEYNAAIFKAMEQALEKYKSRNENYPGALGALVPNYIPKILESGCGGKLNYRYPGTHNENGYDLWLLPCSPHEEQGSQNWP